MGFFDSVVGGLNNMAKTQYKQATGRDYDRDFKMYISEYEYRDSYDIKNEWEKLSDDTSIRHAAKKAAIKDLMKEKGMGNELY